MHVAFSCVPTTDTVIGCQCEKNYLLLLPWGRDGTGLKSRRSLWVLGTLKLSMPLRCNIITPFTLADVIEASSERMTVSNK